MMRRTQPIRIGDLWDDFVEKSPVFSRRLNEARIPDIWPTLVGDLVAGCTTSINVVRGIMYVHISSSAARSEVLMRRQTLKDALNAALGARIVNQIIVK